ncbi:hypothetical protein GCM10020000_06850 [Streptomyces olivoverticillatus]
MNTPPVIKGTVNEPRTGTGADSAGHCGGTVAGDTGDEAAGGWGVIVAALTDTGAGQGGTLDTVNPL